MNSWLSCVFLQLLICLWYHTTWTFAKTTACRIREWHEYGECQVSQHQWWKVRTICSLSLPFICDWNQTLGKTLKPSKRTAAAAAAAAKLLQSCLTCATPWTAAHQAPPSMGFSRQEYSSGVPLPSPKENCESEKVKLLSRVLFFVIPWTIAYQASLSMGLSRQEYWSGLPFPSSGDLPDPGIEPGLLHCRQTLYPLSHQRS